MKNRLKTGSYTCRSLWTAGRRDSTVFGVVDDTTTTKFANRACAVHGISLPVVVDKVVVVVLKFPIITTMVTLELVYLKIMEGAVISPELCISEEEYELMFQCFERELSSRPKVTDIRRRLNKLQKDAEGNRVRQNAS